MNSQGIAVQQYLTTNEPLFAPFAGQDVHGGPPVVLVDEVTAQQKSGMAQPYYLGVFHFFMVRRGPCACSASHTLCCWVVCRRVVCM